MNLILCIVTYFLLVNCNLKQRIRLQQPMGPILPYLVSLHIGYGSIYNSSPFYEIVIMYHVRCNVRARA
jgi:hypothetical protein